jgi:thiol-disulfide isomerase/thioredoxin
LLIPRFSLLIEIGVGRLSSLFGNRATDQRSGFWGGLITGLSLGIVWSPCAGPILASIAALAATQMVSSGIVLVTLAYMAGTGIPLFIFASVGQNLLTKTHSLSPYLGKIRQIFGVVIIVTAIGIWTNYDKIIQAKLLESVPAYSNFLFRLEQNKRVREQLDVLRGKRTRVEETKSFLPDLGPAPDFIGINQWLNSEPLTLSSLRGKVILVDFWTYTCINCIRTLPYVTGWYEKYKDQGLVVVGVHTPEFEFEKKTENVEKAIKMFSINYPVAQDNDYMTWNNYDNLYWPAKYLIDKDGRVRFRHFGEGEYETMEKAIQALLAETGKPMTGETLALPDLTPVTALTGETYLGLSRMDRFSSNEIPKLGKQEYSSPKTISQDSFALSGSWTLASEYALAQAGSSLLLNFSANRVFLVITPQTRFEKLEVFLDGKRIENDQAGKDVIEGGVKFDEPRLYELIDLRDRPGRHLLQLNFGTEGIRIFAFTFG